MTLELNNHSTKFTSFENTVFVEGKYLKREKIWYKQFTSEAQAEKVIEELIINKNFFPDFTKSKVIEFNNPINPMIKYYYYPTSFEIEKVQLYIVDYLY
tara:strand:- start:300 stop:596 length:297 start_codon:yes stop_codon:yes gene_type:complete